MYRWLDIFAVLVRPTLILNQSIFSVVDVIDFGVIKDVMYAVSSFLNASFLNPSEFSDICPKLELELVTEASPPDSALTVSYKHLTLPTNSSV